MEKVINKGDVLRTFINSIMSHKLTEAIPGAAPAALMAEDDDDLEQALAGSAEDEQPQQQQNAPQQNSEQQQPAEVDINAIIEKLNSIRSGRSFRDSAVEEKMNAFFSGLEDTEKSALYKFLNGIDQAVTGALPTENTTAQPSDQNEPPAPQAQQTQSTKQPAAQPATPAPQPKKPVSLKLKPNIIVNKPNDKKAQKPNQEDTSGPAPINPKKR